MRIRASSAGSDCSSAMAAPRTQLVARTLRNRSRALYVRPGAPVALGGVQELVGGCDGTRAGQGQRRRAVGQGRAQGFRGAVERGGPPGQRFQALGQRLRAVGDLCVDGVPSWDELVLARPEQRREQGVPVREVPVEGAGTNVRLRTVVNI